MKEILKAKLFRLAAWLFVRLFFDYKKEFGGIKPVMSGKCHIDINGNTYRIEYTTRLMRRVETTRERFSQSE